MHSTLRLVLAGSLAFVGLCVVGRWAFEPDALVEGRS